MNSTKINWSNNFSPAANSLPSGGLKEFLEIINTKKDVISLGIGEPDFSAPANICAKVMQSLHDGQTKYTSCYGNIELRRAIAKYMEESFGASYNPDKEIMVTVGVSEGLDLAMRVLVGPGDEVLLPEPAYVANRACVLLTGAKPVGVPTYAEHGFAPRIEELEQAVTPKTKVIMISYPTNPTGATLNLEQLTVIAKFAEKHNLIVISDELYSDLTFNGKHVSFSTLPGMRERTITLNGFSKAYAMTGMRIGYAMAPHEVIEAMVNIHQYTMLCAPITAQIGALEALQNTSKERDHMIESYNRRRLIMVEGFKRIGMECFEPQGAFYIFPSIKSSGLSSMDFSKGLLIEHEVAVIPGSAFGDAGEGFVRCAYCNSDANLKEAINRIDKFINK